MEVLIDGVRYVPETNEAPVADVPPGYLSEHFREAEFACNHCGSLGSGIDPQLVQVLEVLRSRFGGAPVTVTSGYRCKVHNDNVGSTDSSQHRKGTAADVQVKGVSPQAVYQYLVEKYPEQYGIGRYDSFTHVDTRSTKARW